MIRYKLNTSNGEVVVSLDSEQPHKVAPLRYEGHPDSVRLVKRWLFYANGVYGQQIADWCAPSDLRSAVESPGAERFAPVLIEETTGFSVGQSASRKESAG